MHAILANEMMIVLDDNTDTVVLSGDWLAIVPLINPSNGVLATGWLIDEYI